MVKFKMLIVGCSLVIISGCSLFKEEVAPIVIISIGDCEHGIVSAGNIKQIQAVWTEARQTDVLISGGCYQDYFIKKGK